MAKSDIWMPFYVADYLADTMHLSAAEHGGYLMLILHYWRTGPIPNDPERLANISRLGNAWSNASSTLLAFFEQDAGMLIHRRIDREKQEALSNKDRNEARARAGAAKRWANHAPSTASSNATSMPESCSSPSPSPTSKEVLKTTRAPRFDARDMPMPLGLKAEKWEEWVYYKSSVKKPLKKLTAEKQIAFLSEMICKGFSAGEIIDESIRQGWQGLFEPQQQARASPGYKNIHDQRAETIAILTGRKTNERTSNEHDITGESFRVA